MVHLLRASGALTFLLGLALVIVLALSSWSRFWRLAAVPLWLGGLTTFIAAVEGVCLVMHARNRRQLRPWDQAVDLEAGGFGGGRRPSLASLGGGSGKKHARGDSDASAFSAVDPLRKPSLQSFGPKNEFGDEPWVAHYRGKFLLWRVWDVTAASQNASLRVMQNKVVVSAALWSLVVTVVLAAGVCFIPNYPVLW
jgi:hypothetical protein